MPQNNKNNNNKKPLTSDQINAQALQLVKLIRAMRSQNANTEEPDLNFGILYHINFDRLTARYARTPSDPTYIWLINHCTALDPENSDIIGLWQ